MARKMRKFADGGNARYDRKVKDIESDYQKALKMGKEAGVAKAKYEQRMADAKDDLAKWTKADRTQTRAAEQAAERNLSEARRTKGESVRRSDAFGAKLAEKAPDLRGNTGKVEAVKTSSEPSALTFAQKFRMERDRLGPGKTFTWQGKSYSTNMAGEGASKPKATQSASRSGTGSTGGNKPAAKTPDKTVDNTPKQSASSGVKAGPSAGDNKTISGLGMLGGGWPRAISKPAPKAEAPNTPSAYSRYLASTMSTTKAAEADRAARDAKTKAAADAAAKDREAKRKQLVDSMISDSLGKTGPSAMKKGGKVKTYAKGGKIDGCAVRGMTRAARKK